jgi:hypothetical protein
MTHGSGVRHRGPARRSRTACGAGCRGRGRCPVRRGRRRRTTVRARRRFQRSRRRVDRRIRRRHIGGPIPDNRRSRAAGAARRRLAERPHRSPVRLGSRVVVQQRCLHAQQVGVRVRLLLAIEHGLVSALLRQSDRARIVFHTAGHRPPSTVQQRHRLRRIRPAVQPTATAVIAMRERPDRQILARLHRALRPVHRRGRHQPHVPICSTPAHDPQPTTTQRDDLRTEPRRRDGAERDDSGSCAARLARSARFRGPGHRCAFRTRSDVPAAGRRAVAARPPTSGIQRTGLTGRSATVQLVCRLLLGVDAVEGPSGTGWDALS